jgi:two-component system phosphate regulon sensor histidine kinase PhoR
LQLESETPNQLGSSISVLWGDHVRVLDILSTIKEGVLAVDPQRNVVMMNEAAKRVLDFTENTPFNSMEVSNFPEAIIVAIDSALEGRVYDGSWKKGAKSTRRYFSVHAVPAQSQDGCVLVLRDQTKVKRLERVRRDFIANISHELRTPVTIVRANAETLLEGAMHDEEYGPKFASAILRNGERLSRLINELLDLSRIEAGQYTMIIRNQEIRPIVEQVLLNLRTAIDEAGYEVLYDVEESLTAAFDDRALEQILSNYVENAIKYAASEEAISISVRAFSESETVCIEVADNGIGIPSKYRRRVFERFYRVDKGRSREAGGSGLGLSIVKHLAEAMNGSVGVKKAKPNGSVFWCRLQKSISKP